MVGGSEADQSAQLSSPELTFHFAKVASAAGDQPAHAVSEERQLREGCGPSCNELFEQHRQRSPVGRDVQPAVVVKINGSVSQVPRERSPVVMPVPAPLPVVQAAAV